MKIYLVGGAVRDALLGLPVKDRDWVVVGATPQDMLDAGCYQVGRHFPVFLHPKTNEEYALARTERKSGCGYVGFTCYSTPEITLAQDLQRRDLTINALAQDADGRIIDLYGGQKDLKNCLLRHVSPAFSEDPLRILRVARFAARYAHLSFQIADETMELMSIMTKTGELEYLPKERIWKETQDALSTKNPQVFFQVLRNCGALKVLFPQIDALFNIPIPEKWNFNKTDIGTHTLLALSIVAMLSQEIDVRFATLYHNLGKRFPENISFPDQHETNQEAIASLDKICHTLRVPNEMRDLGKLVIEFHEKIHIFPFLHPRTIVKIFEKLDAWRKPHRIEKIALTSEANMRARIGLKESVYPQGRLLREAWEVVKKVSSKEVLERGFTGPSIREEIKKRRIQAVADWKKRLLLAKMKLLDEKTLLRQ